MLLVGDLKVKGVVLYITDELMPLLFGKAIVFVVLNLID